jgi:threonine-phosphate decarboxylase
VLVRGCEPFPGLGPGYFRIAVRGAAENERLVAAIREEL